MKSESKVAQSCPTLSEPMDCSLPVSSVHGIFQARVLEWGAIAFSAYSIYISYKYLLKKVSCSDLMLSFSAWFWRLWLASVCFYMLNYNQLYVFLFCSWGSPFLLWTTFCKNLLHHDPSVLGGPAWHGSKLYKAVIHMIILVSFLWLCFLFQRLGDYGSYFFCLPSDGWE